MSQFVRAVSSRQSTPGFLSDILVFVMLMSETSVSRVVVMGVGSISECFLLSGNMSTAGIDTF